MSLKKNLFVDLAIFAGFLIAFEPALTGIAIHEWFSLALAGALIAHILLHWNWVVGVAARFFRKLFHSSRLNFVLNSLLFVAFVAVNFSGVMISKSILPALGIPAADPGIWRPLHAGSADISLALMALHFALHWRWVVNTCKRHLIAPLRRHPAASSPEASTTMPAGGE